MSIIGHMNLIGPHLERKCNVPGLITFYTEAWRFFWEYQDIALALKTPHFSMLESHLINGWKRG